MSQNQTDRPTNRRRTDRHTPRRTEDRGRTSVRRIAAPDDETDAPLVPDLGRRGGTDTEPYRPDPFDRMLMEDAE